MIFLLLSQDSKNKISIKSSLLYLNQVPYNGGCDIENAAMNNETGTFTVVQPGIYRITFTARLFLSNKGGGGGFNPLVSPEIMPELDIMEKDLNPCHHNKGDTEDSMINVFELIMTHYQL